MKIEEDFEKMVVNVNVGFESWFQICFQLSSSMKSLSNPDFSGLIGCVFVDATYHLMHFYTLLISYSRYIL